MTSSRKTFGIGLNKTGTTTLGICLSELGFEHSSFSLDLLEKVYFGKVDALFKTVDQHDSFEDWPYPLMYQLLDQRYPGSRFILTRRSSAQTWLRSLEQHALRTDPEIGPKARTLAYGFPFPQLDREAHLRVYQQHLESVRSYFKDRLDDLLEVCWEEHASWEPLCNFLGMSPPAKPFPHANASTPADPQRRLQNEELIQYFKKKCDLQ